MNAQIAAIAAAKPLVGMWMNWMMIILLLSVLFVWRRQGARVVLLAFIATMPVAMLIFTMTKNVNLIGIAPTCKSAACFLVIKIIKIHAL